MGAFGYTTNGVTAWSIPNFKNNKPYFRFISQGHPRPQQTDTS